MARAKKGRESAGRVEKKKVDMSTTARWPTASFAIALAQVASGPGVRKSKKKKRVRTKTMEKAPRPIVHIHGRSIALKTTDEDTYGPLKGDRLVTRLMVEHADASAQQEGDGAEGEGDIKVCPSYPVSPNVPKEIDANFTSVASDGRTVRYPSQTHRPAVQMWEPFLVVAVLSLPFFADATGHEREQEIYDRAKADKGGKQEQRTVLTWHERHVERLLAYKERQLLSTFPSPLIQEHLKHPALRHQDSHFFIFLSEFLRRKFEPYIFDAPYLFEYVKEAIMSPKSSPDDRTPRVYTISPWVLQLLKNTPGSLFEDQYQEMLSVMRSAAIHVSDVVAMVAHRRQVLAKSVWAAVLDQEPPALDFEQLGVYVDASLVARKDGGHSLAEDPPALSTEDQLLVRKVGATLEEIVTGKNIVAVLRARAVGGEGPSVGAGRRGSATSGSAATSSETASTSDQHSSLPSELPGAQAGRTSTMVRQRIDPEDLRFNPIGLTLTEAFLLVHGSVLAMERGVGGAAAAEAEGGCPWVLRGGTHASGRDRHVLAAAVLIDLYMREKVDVWSWQVLDGEVVAEAGAGGDDIWASSVANVYRVFAPKTAPLWAGERSKDAGAPHWLLSYLPFVSEIFEGMCLPPEIGDAPAWGGMLAKGVLEEVEVTKESPLEHLLEHVGRRLPQRANRAMKACARWWARRGDWLRRRARNAGKRALAATGLNELLPYKLVRYEFVPPAWSETEHEEVSRWLDELDARRRMANTWVEGDNALSAIRSSKGQELMALAASAASRRNRGTLARTSEFSTGRSAPASAPAGGALTPAADALGPGTFEPPHGELEAIVEAFQSGADTEVTAQPSAALQDDPLHAAAPLGGGAASEQAPIGRPAALAPEPRRGAAARSHGTACVDAEAPPRGPPEVAREPQHVAAPPRARVRAPSASSDGSSYGPAQVEGGAEGLRREWWERLKVLYCDAYTLMFEEGVIYFEGEQEVALWRAQVLMFLFSLQTLCDAAWETKGGLERLLCASCPPFAQLPLKPPPGLEAAGAVVRGLAERARLFGVAGAGGKAGLTLEAGELLESMREDVRTELLLNRGHELLSLLDGDSDGLITLDELADGVARMPGLASVLAAGAPHRVVEALTYDFAAELFQMIDDDGNGMLTRTEIRDAVEEQRKRVKEGKNCNAAEARATRKRRQRVLQAAKAAKKKGEAA